MYKITIIQTVVPNKITVIKLVRTISNFGLKQAKEVVDFGGTFEISDEAYNDYSFEIQYLRNIYGDMFMKIEHIDNSSDPNSLLKEAAKIFLERNEVDKAIAVLELIN